MVDYVLIERSLLVRLLASAGGDDMLAKCDECGAWFYIDDERAATIDEFSGCWWSATRRDQDVETCFRIESARMVFEHEGLENSSSSAIRF